MTHEELAAFKSKGGEVKSLPSAPYQEPRRIKRSKWRASFKAGGKLS